MVNLTECCESFSSFLPKRPVLWNIFVYLPRCSPSPADVVMKSGSIFNLFSEVRTLSTSQSACSCSSKSKTCVSSLHKVYSGIFFSSDALNRILQLLSPCRTPLRVGVTSLHLNLPLLFPSFHYFNKGLEQHSVVFLEL